MLVETIKSHRFYEMVDSYGDRQYMVSYHHNVSEVLADDSLSKEVETHIVEALFTQGRCHVYAAVMQSFNPSLQLKVAYVNTYNDEEETTVVKHVYAVNPETRKAYDVYGEHENEEALLSFDGSYYYDLDVEDLNLDDLAYLVSCGELLPPGEDTIKLAYNHITSKGLHKV